MHIVKDDNEAKYNIAEGKGLLVYNHGFKKHDLTIIEQIIEDNVDVISERWREFFKK